MKKNIKTTTKKGVRSSLIHNSNKESKKFWVSKSEDQVDLLYTSIIISTDHLSIHTTIWQSNNNNSVVCILAHTKLGESLGQKCYLAFQLPIYKPICSNYMKCCSVDFRCAYVMQSLHKLSSYCQCHVKTSLGQRACDGR